MLSNCVELKERPLLSRTGIIAERSGVYTKIITKPASDLYTRFVAAFFVATYGGKRSKKESLDAHVSVDGSRQIVSAAGAVWERIG